MAHLFRWRQVRFLLNSIARGTFLCSCVHLADICICMIILLDGNNNHIVPGLCLAWRPGTILRWMQSQVTTRSASCFITWNMELLRKWIKAPQVNLTVYSTVCYTWPRCDYLLQRIGHDVLLYWPLGHSGYTHHFVIYKNTISHMQIYIYVCI